MRQLWVKKHAPKDIGEFCFSSSTIKKMIRQFIDSQSIPHLLLTGAPGTGKSTLARLLIEDCGVTGVDVLTIDASLDNNVDVVRDRVKSFVSIASFDSPFKIVLLEEFDHMSVQAQSTLREMMVRYSDDVRFILTANYVHRITEPIISRCQHITFQDLPFAAAVRKVISILDQEAVEYDLDVVEAIVKHNLPDLRKIINIVQQHSVSGTLIGNDQRVLSSTALMIRSGDFDGLLNWASTAATTEFDRFYTDVFESISLCQWCTSPNILDNAIISTAKYQFQHNQSAAPRICASALISELRLITKVHE